MSHQINTAKEAWSAIVAAVVYFLCHHTAKTLLIIAIVAGAVVYTLIDYSKDLERAKIRSGQVKQPQ